MGIMKKKGSQKRAGRLEGLAIGSQAVLPGGWSGGAQGYGNLCVLFCSGSASPWRQTPPLLSVELIPHPCSVYTRYTHGPSLPSTATPSGLGRSEDSGEAPDGDSVWESERQCCGFKPRLGPFWSV